MSETVRMQNKKVELGLEMMKNYKDQFSTINERLERLEDIVLQSQENLRNSLNFFEEGLKARQMNNRHGANSAPSGKLRNNFMETSEDMLLDSPSNENNNNRGNSNQKYNFTSLKKNQGVTSQSIERLRNSKMSNDRTGNVLFTEEEEKSQNNYRMAAVSNILRLRKKIDRWLFFLS